MPSVNGQPRTAEPTFGAVLCRCQARRLPHDGTNHHVEPDHHHGLAAIVPRVVEIDGTEIAISMTVPGADAPGAAEREVLLVLAAEEGDDLIDLLCREATHERHPTLASHEDVAAIEARS